MKKALITAVAALIAAVSTASGNAAPAVRRDIWYGYSRTTFEFQGHTAWIVEPKCPPAPGTPWTWTMQWADAFVDRTGVLDLLAKGWHHVTIDTFAHKMDEEGLWRESALLHEVPLEFAAHAQTFLVEKRGFAPKANLIGMSWGGFFSTRYAAAYPDCVAKIYLDAPLMTFASFAHLDVAANPAEAAAVVGPWASSAPKDGDWSKDPRMPVNMAEKLAGAGIPVLLLYGGQDQTVPPKTNCEEFARRFKAAGGRITVVARPLFGHHPHGEDPDKTQSITGFFESGLADGTSAGRQATPGAAH